MDDHVLILSASDTSKAAESLCQDLIECNFSVHILNDQDKKPFDLVTDSAAVIMIISPEFFKNSLLSHLAEMAFISRKLEPVLLGNIDTQIPSWLKPFYVFDLNSEASGREFSSLVITLMNHHI